MDRLQSLKFIVGSMAAAPIMIALVVGVGGIIPDPALVIPDQAVVTAGLTVLTGLIGYFGAPRLMKPLAPGLDDDGALSRSFGAVNSTSMNAAALAESGFLVAFALCFVLGYTGGALLVAAPLATLMVLLAAFPSQSRLRTYQTRLESRGARSGL